MSGSLNRSAPPLNDSRLPYPIYIGRDSAGSICDAVREHAPAYRCVVIVDETVHSLHRDQLLSSFVGIQTALLTVPPGESQKSRERWAILTDSLLELGCGRDTTIVAVGGGVVCDLAGFVAATYMRGISVVQVPTTLLAMVDASVGGKTAVDSPHGKNVIGAFHDPRAVLIDPSLLRTLPAAEFRSGLAEVIKHGVIADVAYLQRVASALYELTTKLADAGELPDIIRDSVRIKADIVAQDRRENGIRKVLNFGHTIAHAFERASNYKVSHGDAVAVGMVVEARIAELLGIASTGLSESIADIVDRAGLPTTVSSISDKFTERNRSPAEIVDLTRTDKKARSGSIRYALPWQLGEMESADGDWSVIVPDRIAEKALK